MFVIYIIFVIIYRILNYFQTLFLSDCLLHARYSIIIADLFKYKFLDMEFSNWFGKKPQEISIFHFLS